MSLFSKKPDSTPVDSASRQPSVGIQVEAENVGSSLEQDATSIGAIREQQEVNPAQVRAEKIRFRRRIFRYSTVTLLAVVGIILILMRLHTPAKTTLGSVSQRYSAQSIPLGDINTSSADGISAGGSVSVNGQLNVNNGLVLAPIKQPANAVAGQLFYNQTTNQLSYYNGKSFEALAVGSDVVSSFGGAKGAITLGNGLGFVNNKLSYTGNGGVLSLQGETGAISLTAGGGVAIDGTTISSTGVLALGGQKGDIAVGSGLSVAGGTLKNNGVLSVQAGSNVSVSTDANGNVTISTTGSGTGSVSSAGGTSGTFAVFDGVQDIANSLLSQSGGVVTVAGDLTVTGNLTLTTALTVGQGGTGAITANGARTNIGAAASGVNSDITSLSGLTTALSVSQGGTGVGTLATNGVLLGNGTSPITAINGSAGDCLVATAGAPVFQACPGTGGVSSVNGLNGAVSIANATAAGSTITLNDASTAAKGIASFNATNFLVSSGAVNTVQDIAVTATPTFAGLNLTTPLGVASGGTGAATAPGARTNLGAAGSGANTDITSLGGLTTALSVIQGGTGAASLTANGVLLGNGTGAVTAVAAGGAGQCLISTVGAPTWTTCPGSGGVASVNGLSGTITISNVTAAGSTITINDAKADGATKGIAAFSSANFSDNGAGVINTIQGIASTDTPSFTGVVLSGGSANAATLAVVPLAGSVTYSLPDPGTASATICLSTGNCAGAGGGVTTVGGTTNAIAMFTGNQTVGDSLVSQDAGATTVTVTGDLSVTGTISGNGSGLTNVDAATLGGNASTYYTNASNINGGTLADGRLSANVPLLNGTTNNFTGATLQHNGSDVCDASGNCAGVGGGVTSSGGTANTYAIFTGTGYSIGDSMLSQDAGATTVTIAGDLAVTGTISGNGSGLTNVDAATLGGNNSTYYTNASNIGSGTLADGRLSTNVTLQGNSFNAAGQLVQLDASSQLPAVNASLLTNLNGSSIASGTVADTYLSGNVSLRNADNNFTGTVLQHNGNDVCDISGNCVGTGGNGAIGGGGTANTIALFTATGYKIGDSILTEDAGATTITVTGDLSVSGSVTAASLAGEGSGVTNVNAAKLGGNSSSYYTNASNIGSGTLADGRLSANVTLQGNTFNGPGQLVVLDSGSGYLPALNGSALTNLNASSLASGTVADGRLSGNVTLLNAASNNFTGATLQHNGNDICDASGNCAGAGGGVTSSGGTANTLALFNAGGFSIGDSLVSQDAGKTTVTITGDLSVTGTISGDGSGLTNVDAATLGGNDSSYYTNASHLSSGTVADGRLSANVTLQGNTFNGIGQLVKLDGTTGYLPALNGSALTSLDGSSIASGTVADARLSANVTLQGNSFNSASQLVQLDGSSQLPAVSGALLTSLNGSNVASGTIANTYLVGSGALSVTAGTGLSGGGSVALGDSTSLSVSYGTTAGTAVQGNVTLTCASGSGPNLSGGGDVITLGGGGSCSDIVLSTTPVFNGLTLGDTSAVAGTVTLHDGSTTHSAILQLEGALTGDVTYSLPNDLTGSQTLCTVESGNCAGSGGGITASGTHTQDYLSKFGSGGTSVTNSSIYDNGTGVSVGGSSPSGLFNVGTSNQFQVSSTGAVTAVGLDSGSGLIQGSNGLTVGGTVTLSGLANGSSECLTADASGVIGLTACLSGGSGGSGGVASLNGLSGTLSINNATASGANITINDGKADGSTKGIVTFNSSNFSDNGAGVINTIQDIGTTATPTFGSLTLGTALSVANGGTGAITAGAALTNLGAAASGANGDITSLSGLTTALSVGQGGTGASTFTANGILVGNGTSAITAIAAGSAGKCLVSTVGAPIWTTCPGSGGVSSVNGLTGAVSIANATAAGSTVTINDGKADGSTKGIVTFNSSNFSDNGAGVINTIQDIGSGATPAFNGLGLSGASANQGTIKIAGTLSSSIAYILPVASADQTICTVEAGNCAGVGGGVTTAGGTIDTLALFTGSGAIGDSLIAQDAGKTTVTITGDLSVTGTVSGNGSGLTNVDAATLGGNDSSYYTNASHLSSGTVADARLSANVTLQGNTFNGVGQLVKLDGTTGYLPALNGSAVTNVDAITLGGNNSSYFTNASNISTGTLADGRLSTNVALLNGSNNFTGATLQHGGYDVCDASGNCVGSAGGAIGGGGTTNTIALFTATGYKIGDSLLTQDAGATTVTVTGDLSVTGTISGNGSGLTNVDAATLGGNDSSYFTNATNLSTGTVSDSRLSANVTLQGNTFNGTGQLVQLDATTGYLPALNGSLLTSLNGSSISSGTVADARLSSNVALLNSASNNFTGAVLQHNGKDVCDASGNCVGSAGGAIGGNGTADTYAIFTGTGYSIGDSMLSQDAGATAVTVAGNVIATGGITASSFSGDGSSLTGVNAAKLNGQAGSYYTDASNINSGTLGDTYLSANVTLQGNTFNGPGQLVVLDSGSGYLPALNGSALTNLNASSLASGTVPIARVSGSYTGIVGTGALAAGSIASGFGTISTTNNITTTAQVQAGTLKGGSTQQFQVDASGNVTTSGGGSFVTGLTLGNTSNAGQLTFYNTSNTHTVQLTATASATANQVINIPASSSATDTICLATAANCSATGAAGGDLSGSYPNPTVAKIRGTNVSLTSIANGDVLQYNGTNIVNGKITNTNLQGGVFAAITGTGALAAGSIASGFGTISTANNITTTVAIQGGSFSNTGGSFAVDASGHVTVALSTTTGTTMVCQNSSSVLADCDASYIAPTATNFIQNQIAQQPSSNFNITGTGKAATLNATSGFQYNGTAGSTTACTGGDVLQNATIQGGIITAASCIVNGGGYAPTLQNVYDNSSSTPVIGLTTVGKGLLIQDAATTVGGNLFAVQSAGGGATYFGVTTGGFNSSGTGTANILQASTFDTASAAALNIGTTNATSIVLQQNTSLASGKTFTANGSGFDGGGNLGVGTTTPGANIDVQSGATSGNAVNITANSLTSGNALNINLNSTNSTAGNLINAAQNSSFTTDASVAGSLLNLNRNVSVNAAVGALTFDTIADPGQGAAAPKTWSQTIANKPNRYLVVACDGSSLAGTPTFNGVTMSLISSVTNPDNSHVLSIWGLAGPAIGTHTVSVPNGSYCYIARSLSWYNVNQTTPLGPIASTSGSGSTSENITSVNGADVVDFIINGTGSASAGGGQTQMAIDSNYSPGILGVSHKSATTTSTTMSWSGSGTIDQIGFALIPSSTALGISGSLANISSNCTNTSGGCTDTSTILNLNQQFVGATGTVLNIQNAGSGDFFDAVNGSGTTLASINAAGLLTTNAGVVINAGGTFTNAGSTLNSALALSNFAANGALGTAAATVDTHTSFTIPQTTASITLTLPNPTVTTAGRLIYIANTGSASISIAGVTLGAGTNGSFFWNGSAWASTAVSTGVTIVGAFDSQAANGNGAVISGNTVYFQSASATNPGMVNTVAQTFKGAKTFSDLLTGNGGLTVTGTVNLNASGTANTNIGNSTGTTTITGHFNTATVGASNSNGFNIGNMLKSGCDSFGDCSLTLSNGSSGGQSIYLESDTGSAITQITSSGLDIESNGGNHGYDFLLHSTRASDPAPLAIFMQGATPASTANMLQLENSSSTVLGGFNYQGNFFYKNGSYTTTVNTATLTGNQTVTLPNATGTVALTNDTADFIRNQTTQQASSNFNISGTGIANILQAGTFDAASAGALNIGTTNATSIALNQNVTVASGKTFTANGSGFDGGGNLGIGTTTPGANLDVQSGATSGNAVNITASGLTSGNGLNINNTSGATTSGNTVNINDNATITSPKVQSGSELNINRNLTTNAGTVPQIALDSKTTASTSLRGSLSWSHTVGNGSNTYLVVTAGYGSGSITSVTYNGVAMTQLTSTTWGLENPTPGTHTVAITASAYIVASASSWFNVDPTDPIGTTVSLASTPGSIPSSNTDMIIDSMSSGYPASYSAGSGQTQLANGCANTVVCVGSSYKQGTAGTTSMTEGSNSGSYSIISLQWAGSGSTVAITGAAANIQSNCTVVVGPCSDSSNVLNLGQKYASATGTVLNIQNAGSGDFLDLVSGSGTTLTSINAAGLLTTSAGVTINAGGSFINAGSTVLSSKALSLGTSGAIGTAAATVDGATTFDITATAASLAFTIPSPTLTTSGHIIYINNVGTNGFTIGSVNIGAGASSSFIWNGTTWTSTAVSTGVSLIGAFDTQTANGNGATISGNTIYFQSASTTNPGMVNTVAQTFKGNKTFNNNVTVGGAFTVTSSTFTIGNLAESANHFITSSCGGAGCSLNLLGDGGGSITLDNDSEGNYIYVSGKTSFTNNSDGLGEGAVTISQNYANATTPALQIFEGATPTATADMLQLSNSGGTILGGFNNVGQLYYKNGTFTTTVNTAALTGNQTITLPNATGTVALTNDTANFIRNQTTQQASSNFNISGTGTAASLQAGSLDTAASGGTLIVGGTNASTVLIGSNDFSTGAGPTSNILVGNSAANTVVAIGAIGAGAAASLTGETVIVGSATTTTDGSTLAIQGDTAIVASTTNNAVAFSVQGVGSVNVLNVDTVNNAVTIGNDIATGGVFINNGSTLNAALALTDFATGGSIGTAPATVDTHTSFTVNQTTAGQTLTLPSPTVTTAGRIMYIANVGTAAFTIGGNVISSGTNATFLWNGTTWSATAVSTGVTLVGALNGGTANATGATISGNTIYLQSASSSFAGLVSTAAQTFAGKKTFNDGVDNNSYYYQNGQIVINTDTNGNSYLGLAGNTTTTGDHNTAVGAAALQSNSSGYWNVAVGDAALTNNTSGQFNTALGTDALVQNTTGRGNVAIGYDSLGTSTGGWFNTAIGYQANIGSANLQNATAIGQDSYVTASNSLVLGCISGTNSCTTTTKIGIGNTAPAALFSVGSSSQFQVDISGNVQTSGTIKLSGTTTASATSSLIQIGNAIAGGNAVANGGTYIGLNTPASGAGSAADLLNLQAGGTSMLKLDNAGNLTVGNTSANSWLGTGSLDVNHTLTVDSGGCSIVTAIDSAGESGGITANGACLNFDISNAYNGGVSINGDTFDPSGLLTANGGITIATGKNFINGGSTLNTSKALSLGASGAIGTAAATVNAYTTFDITATAGSLAFTLPSPTVTTSGRIVYINNVGATNSFIINGATLGTGSSANFIWNGSTWTTTAVSTGVSLIGTFSLTPTANGASITGNTITFSAADATHPGMVSTSAQTFAGNKTFSSNVIAQNTLTIGNLAAGTAGSIDFVQGLGDTSSVIHLESAGDAGLDATVYLPPINGATLCVDTGNCDGSTGNGGYIVNSTSTQIGTANFHITGTGIANKLQATTFDTSAAGALSIGTANATSIAIGKSGVTTTVTGPFTQSGGNFSLTGTGTSSLTAGGSLNLSAAGGSTFTTTSGNLTLGTSANAGQVIIQANGTGGFVSIGDNTATTITIGNTSNTTRTVSIANGNTSTNATVNLGSMGTVNIGATGSAAYSNTTNINNTTSGTGTQIVNIGSSANVANALVFEAGNTGKIQIGNGATAHTIAMGTGAAVENITIGSTTSSSATTIQGGTGNIQLFTNSASATIAAKSGTNSATAFQVQNSSSVAYLNVDTTTTGGTITFGTGANTVVYTAGGGLTANGTARHTKTILLTPEYAGAVLDAASDGTCASASNGTMTSGYDSTNRMNYYNWTTSQATAQCYDVVVQIPIPSDFDGWVGALGVSAKTDNNSYAGINLSAYDSTGTGGTIASGGVPTSWASTSGPLTGTYTPGTSFTVKIRMSEQSSGNMQLGNLSVQYYSKF